MTKPFEIRRYGNEQKRTWKASIWLKLVFVACAASFAWTGESVHAIESIQVESAQTGVAQDDEDSPLLDDLCALIEALGGDCSDLDHVIEFDLGLYTDHIYALVLANGVPKGQNGAHASLVSPVPSAYRTIANEPDRFGQTTSDAAMSLLSGIWSESGGDPTSLEE